jgi:uncharacterized protein YbjT (DUF2867 family)
MAAQPLDAVTGAFGYSGRAITKRLLESGRRVRTLTGHPRHDDPLFERVEVAPLDFDQPTRLAASLAGVDTLYNTYWVRFDRGPVSFDRAVVESAALFTAARAAGVRRVVHLSITNADEASPLPYFAGKARVERALRASGLSYAIVRPTVIAGDRDILVHDIAWCVRHLPLFGVAGDRSYHIQPVMMEDVTRIAVEVGGRSEDLTIDAVGPDIFTYEELVRLIAAAVGGRAWIVHLPCAVVMGAAAVIGAAVGDVVLTREELAGLMASLLVSEAPPTGRLHLADWLRAHRADVGRSYASELARHYQRA